MKIILHRINKTGQLTNIPKKYGVEVDVRGYGNRLLLNHNPIDNPEKYDDLEEYLKNFKHAFIIFNLKEAGYESQVIALAKKNNIKNYFLLDVEFPYIFKATRIDKFRKIAVRFSEAEPIEAVEAQTTNGSPLVDWVWIDTNTILPLTKNIIDRLKPFKTCLVCPERWGRSGDIIPYIARMKKLGFYPDAVMTSEAHAHIWENSFKK
jgi:hypothetical protein